MVVVLAVLALAALIWLPPLHPAQLWLIPWAIAAGLYLMRLFPYRTLDTKTVVLVCGSSIAVVIGVLGGERIGQRLPRRAAEPTEPAIGAIGWAAALALSLTALLLFGFLAQAASRYGARAALISTLTVRDAIGQGAFPITVKYVYAALAATALCAIAAATDRRKAAWWTVGGLAAVGSIYFSTGRSTFVVGGVVGLVAYLLARAKPLSRARFIAGCAGVGAFAVIVFVIGGNLIGKTYANNPGIQEVSSTFTKHPHLRVLALPYEYASAPIAALDVQVDASTPWGTTNGCAAFSEECRVLGRLGFGLTGTSRIRPFTTDPLPWNTYTALDVPLLDGGYILAIPILGLFGLLLGLLWNLAQRRNVFGVCTYAILAPAAVTASGSFNLTAPHLVGAVVIALTAIVVAAPLRRVMRREPVPLSEF
jgi:hypothetical protein